MLFSCCKQKTAVPVPPNADRSYFYTMNKHTPVVLLNHDSICMGSQKQNKEKAGKTGFHPDANKTNIFNKIKLAADFWLQLLERIEVEPIPHNIAVLSL